MAKIGKVISNHGPIVDVEFSSHKELPSRGNILETFNHDGQRIVLEVIEYINEQDNDQAGIVRCIGLTSMHGLQRNAEVVDLGSPVKTPVGLGVCSRILNVLGQPIDKKGKVDATEFRSIHNRVESSFKEDEKKSSFELIETGIKAIDVLFPLVEGTKTGILGGAGLGKSVLVLELMYNTIRRRGGYCVFTGAGERTREGNELYLEMVNQGIIDRSVLVFGQMNESPGARFEIVKTGITLAEYFQEQREDVLFFVDSVFRFAQAGSELSTLLGRIPSETGYQPTLNTEMSDFQERIRSSLKGTITAIEAVYVPSDDLTDPAVVCTFSHLDSTIVLSRRHMQLGLYPAIDPLQSSCSYLDPFIVGKRHFEIAQNILKILNRYEELRRIVSIVGVEELSKEDRIIYGRAQKIQNFLTQPFSVATVFTGKDGEYVSLQETLEGFKKIISGQVDAKPKEEFYMIGAL